METDLSKGALSYSSVEIEVEEVYLAIEVNWTCATAEDTTHRQRS